MEIVGSKTFKASQIVQEETQITLSSLHSHNSPSSSLFISFYSFHLFLFFLLPFQTFYFLISPPFQLLKCFFSHHPFPFFVTFVASIFSPFPSPFFHHVHSFLWETTSHVLTSIFCRPQKCFRFRSLLQQLQEDTWHLKILLNILNPPYNIPCSSKTYLGSPPSGWQ